MKFNSQICTSREQSERLLALGLKPETADIEICCLNGEIRFLEDENYQDTGITIPAWSLHRLVELKEPNTIDNALVILSRKQTYDKLIGIIAKSIKEGYFNKEYLEEQADSSREE